MRVFSLKNGELAIRESRSSQWRQAHVADRRSIVDIATGQTRHVVTRVALAGRDTLRSKFPASRKGEQ